MLLNAQPLNAAVLNASGDAPAQTLAASLQASATVDLAQARQGFALSASLQAAATVPTAQPGAAQPLGGTLAASGVVSTSVLNRTSSALAATLAGNALLEASVLGVGMAVAGQLSASGASAATLTWLMSVSANPLAGSATVSSAGLASGAGPLASALTASASAVSLSTVQSHAMTAAVAAVAQVWPILQWGNPIAAQAAAAASIGSSALSTTHKTLNATLSASAEVALPGFVMATTVRGLLEVSALGSYAFLENTSRGRLAGSNYGVAHVFADMPQHRRLNTAPTSGIALSRAELKYQPFLAGSISSEFSANNSVFLGGGVLQAEISCSATVDNATTVAVYWLVGVPAPTFSLATKADLRTPEQPLSATLAFGAATVVESNLNPIRLLSASLQAGAEYTLYGALKDWSKDKNLVALIAGSASVGNSYLIPEALPEYNPTKNLFGDLNAGAQASGTIIGGGYALSATASASASIQRSEMPLPNYPQKDFFGELQGTAKITRQEFRTSRQELSAALEVSGFRALANLDKWPDIRELATGPTIGEAVIEVAYLHSPNVILLSSLKVSADAGRAGLGYVLELQGAGVAASTAIAEPRIEKSLSGQSIANVVATGYVVNLGVLQAFINNGTAQVSAALSLAYSFTAEAAAAAQADPDLRLTKRLESSHLVLAAVNGRLSVLYRGVDIDGPTAATATLSAAGATVDLSVDAIYADDIEVEYAAFLKAA